MKLLLLGATGLVGHLVLERALADPAVSSILAPTRRPLASHAKLSNLVTPDLHQAHADVGTYRADALICALGSTRAKAGSKEAFRRVDLQLPIALAQSAHAAGARACAIVTFLGASAKSRIFYLKIKGEVEEQIRVIGFSSLTICRPSLIDGERPDHRLTESLGLGLARVLAPVLPKALRVNPAEVIAAALLDAVIVARPGLRWIQADQMNGPSKTAHKIGRAG